MIIILTKIRQKQWIPYLLIHNRNEIRINWNWNWNELELK